MTKNRLIDNIVSDQLCLGCGACAQIVGKEKIDFKISEDGFLRPFVIDELSTENEVSISKVCPGIHVGIDDHSADYSDLWGSVHSVHVGWSTDENIRHLASSGGGISAVLCYLLSNGKVDCVLHSGVSESDPLENTYKISTRVEQVIANSGSRYAPAAPLMGIMDAIREFNSIAFVGKPCDVVALRKLANELDVVKRKVKYAISFMCAGTPSIKGTEAILKNFSIDRESVLSFDYRGDGWPGMATAVTKCGDKHSMTYNSSWGKILNKHLQVRCKLCNDGTGESADITFADAWHGDESGYPNFDEQKGRSLILIRSECGNELIKQAVATGDLYVEPFDKNNIEKIQPYQAMRKKLIFSRILAMKFCFQRTPSYPWRNIFRLALGAGIKNNVVSFMGMVKRILRLRFG